MEYDKVIDLNQAKLQLDTLISRVNRPTDGVIIQNQADHPSAVLVGFDRYQKLMDLTQSLVDEKVTDFDQQLAVLNALDNFRVDDNNLLLSGGYGYCRRFFAKLANVENGFDTEILASLGTFAVYVLSIQNQIINLDNLLVFTKQSYQECLKQYRIGTYDYGERSLWGVLTKDCIDTIHNSFPDPSEQQLLFEKFHQFLVEKSHV